jgi:ribosomal protein S12 methylthiotransferase accessory factor
MVGLVENVHTLQQELGAPAFAITATGLDDLSALFPSIKRDPLDDMTGGGSADVDREIAAVRAVVEAAERYASMVHTEGDFIVATARELGEQALDLDTIPRCSARELANPKCPLRLPAKDVPIHWAQGYSLIRRKKCFAPAAMTHLYAPRGAHENFWLPISTGVAAHTALAPALCAAICESIERDAFALAWLLKLPLPRVSLGDPIPTELQSVVARLRASRVQHEIFDATTDMSVPTALSVQLAEGHPQCSLMVSCATTFDPTICLAKSIREAAACRVALTRERTPVPADVEDFFGLTHGANYYGQGKGRADFDFLLERAGGENLSAAQFCAKHGPAPTSDVERLERLLALLEAKGFDAIALDLTTDEVREAGLWVVRVVIPQLMPISFVHRARYLGTPRLHDYARQVGLGELREQDIQAGPIPFA